MIPLTYIYVLMSIILLLCALDDYPLFVYLLKRGAVDRGGVVELYDADAVRLAGLDRVVGEIKAMLRKIEL